MRILLAASEAVPFAKTGGLADVLGALPKALAHLGHDPVVVLPLHGSIDRQKHGLEKTGWTLWPSTSIWSEELSVFRARLGNVEAWLLESETLFGNRKSLYGEGGSDYADNPYRFAVFAHAVARLLAEPPDGKRFDVLHVHDWQAALAPAIVRALYPSLEKTGSLFTIHNLAYQGNFPAAAYPLTGLPPELFSMGGLEFWGQVSYLKAGLVSSDILNTVSPKYASEILTPEFGAGMEGMLQARKADLHGVLNGVDYDEWSPERDRFISAKFSAENPSAKDLNRNALLREMGLPPADPVVPLAGIVSRLVAQKGFDLIDARLEQILDRVRLVVLGSGEAKYEERFRAMAAKRPDRIAVKIGYDDALAHKIEAAADFFLMPSAFEPCGLNQMYSLRYGTVPIVRAVGGLDDTVIDADRAEKQNGFKFPTADPDALLRTIDRAIATRRDAKRWAQIRRNGMTADFSWAKSAMEYVRLYQLTKAKRA